MGEAAVRKRLMRDRFANIVRLRVAAETQPIIRLRAGPQTPSPEGGRLPFYSSCSISSFFSGNSAAGSALKVRMPSFK